MSAPWKCWVCGGGDGEYEGKRVCDCVTLTRKQVDAMIGEWRAARDEIRRLNDHHHDPSLVMPEDFEMLDSVLLGGECRTENLLLPGPIVLGGDSCA